MKMRISLILVITISVLLTSCAGLSQNIDLEGTSWVLVRYANQPPIPGTAPTLSFEDGQVGGNASCNSFGGDVRLSGDRIEFGDLFWTLMACMDPEGVMEQEQAYMALLGQAQHFEVMGNQLVITTVGGDTLVFDPAD